MLFCTDSEENSFVDTYLELFATRFTYGSLRVENDKDLTASNRMLEIYNNLNAFKYLIMSGKQKLLPQDIQEVAGIVNREIGNFNKGYRKTAVLVNTAPWIPVAAKQIPAKIWYLLDNYYNLWNELDPFLREAKFHIMFIKIHPFEDGNGRTSRLLLNYHLFLQSLAPVIVDADERQKYFDMIDEDREEELAEFFREKSKAELNSMLELYSIILFDEEGKQFSR